MSRAWTTLVTMSLTAALVAGCIGGGDGADSLDTPPDQAPPVVTTGETGTVKGQVLAADSLEPRGGATVTLVPVSGLPIDTKVAQNGDYVINNVAPGRYQVIVFAPGYEQATKSVDVAAATVKIVSFMMEPLPSDKPYHTSDDYEGRIGYAYTYWVEPAGVGCIVETVPIVGAVKSCGGGRSGSGGQFPSENGEIDFEVTNDTKTVIVEMTWDPAGELGKYLSLDLLCPDVPRDGPNGAVLDIEHACYWDADNVQSPIQFRVDEAHWLEHGYNYTGNWAARVFSSYGMLGTYDATGIDAGVAYQQAFTIYVSVFHKEPAPEGFTGIPDG